MKINLIVISKTDQKYMHEGVQEYVKRLTRYIQFELIEIPDLKNAKNMSTDEQKKKEGDLILQKIEKGSEIILLDDKGKDYTSMQFSKQLQDKMNSGVKVLTFIIGGPYGFSEEIYALAHSRFSLSRMTFSHQMVRLIFLEQLYRGFTILKNEPYHHE
jgi:23S rRNA (pseudouridine1915-N3)-methyltransferase